MKIKNNQTYIFRYFTQGLFNTFLDTCLSIILFMLIGLSINYFSIIILIFTCTITTTCFLLKEKVFKNKNKETILYIILKQKLIH